MNKTVKIFLAIFCAFFISSCLEEGEKTLLLVDKLNRFVDINDPQDIQNALIINNSSTANGELPPPSSGYNYLSTSINSIKVNAGSTVVLPLIYTGGYDIKKVYIQVTGAEGYFSVNPTLVTGADGMWYISIAIPKNIDDGEFSVRYEVEDERGNISNIVTTKVEITNEVVSCENAYATGQSGLTFTTLYLAEKSGPVVIDYDTYSVPDRIDIYQGTNWITGTGTNPNSPIPPLCNCSNTLPGFVGRSGKLTFDYDASKGQNITVVVSGCLNGGTSWEWALSEAPVCNSGDEGGSTSSVYTPYNGKQVSKIAVYSSKSGNLPDITFSYDASGRITSMTKRNVVYTFDFKGNALTVKADGSTLYQAELNAQGYISAVTNQNASFTYNSNAYLTRCTLSNGYRFDIKYNSKNNQTEVSTTTTGSPSVQTYTFSTYENKANIDFNAITSSSFPYEAWFGTYGILSPFSLFGKRSPNLISQEVYSSEHTFKMTYTVDADGYPTKITETDNATVNNNGTTTYTISYK
jgi:hypothetical protein